MQISMASWVDVFQLGKQLLSHLNMGAEKKVFTPTTAKPAEDMPESVLASRFTKVDEAVYCGNLKSRLSEANESAIDLLETQMKSHQVEQFRLMILNMVNHPIPTEKMVPILDKAGKDTGTKKPVTEMIDPAFTKNDSRVIRLRSYAKRILSGTDVSAQTVLAKAIVTKLLQEGSITEKSVSDIAKEKFDSGKQAVSDGLYHGVAFAQLGQAHTDIHSNFVLTEERKERMISETLDAKLVAKKAELDRLGFKSVFTNKWTYAFILPIVIGIIYILFL